jgi:hypothetical protein
MLWIHSTRFLRGASVWAILVACQSAALAQLHPQKSLGAAVETSRRLGFPLLVLATQESCPPCRVLKQQIQEDQEITRLLHGCIKIQLDCDSADYQQWIRRHPPANPQLPQLFLLRGDGRVLLNLSGTRSSQELRQVLAERVSQAGKSLTEAETQAIHRLTMQLNQKLAAEGCFAAAEMLQETQRTLTLAHHAYAENAIELRESLEKIKAELMDQIEATRKQLDQLGSLSGDEQVAAANRIETTMERLKRIPVVSMELHQLQQAAAQVEAYTSIVKASKSAPAVMNRSNKIVSPGRG